MLGLVAECDEPSLNSGVSASRGRGYAICHEVQRAFLESFHVNLDGTCSCGGMTIGDGNAVGTRRKNPCNRNRGRASAIAFFFPGTSTALTMKLYRAVVRNRISIKCIMFGVLDVLVRIIATTLSLSHLNWTRFCYHFEPQSAHADTIGKSSLYAIHMGSWAGNHRPLSHSL